MLWSIRVVIVVLVLVVHDMKFLQGSDYLGNWRLLRINESPLVEFSPCSTSVPQWTPCKPGKQKAGIKTPCKPVYKKKHLASWVPSRPPLSPSLLSSEALQLHLASTSEALQLTHLTFEERVEQHKALKRSVQLSHFLGIKQQMQLQLQMQLPLIWSANEPAADHAFNSCSFSYSGTDIIIIMFWYIVLLQI